MTVLKSGPDFRPQYVQAMQRQLKRWAPEADFVCLSDVAVPGVGTIPLKQGWPDWWCKMSAFDPAIRGDFLLTDLDNIFVGSLDDIVRVDTYTTQQGESNALAFYPEDVRAAIWKEWIRDPQAHMDYWHPHKTPVKHQFGDGGFIKSLMTAQTHWEDALPGQVTNLNVIGGRTGEPHMPFMPLCRSLQLPPNARVLLCWRPHRPWRVPMLRRFGMYEG